MRFPILAYLTVALTLLVGCVPGTYRYSTYVDTTPPEPYDEFVPASPGAEYVWISGYWWWDGGDWVWIQGRWGYPPGDGYSWSRSGWTVDSGRHVFVHGRWVRPSSSYSVQYVHPAPTFRVNVGGTYRASPRGTTQVRVRR